MGLRLVLLPRWVERILEPIHTSNAEARREGVQLRLRTLHGRRDHKDVHEPCRFPSFAAWCSALGWLVVHPAGAKKTAPRRHRGLLHNTVYPAMVRRGPRRMAWSNHPRMLRRLCAQATRRRIVARHVERVLIWRMDAIPAESVRPVLPATSPG